MLNIGWGRVCELLLGGPPFLKKELNANFQLNQFGHYAFYNPGQSRIEMHLVSLKNQTVRIGDSEISFKLGEGIWTESSYKYTLEEFVQLAATADFSVERVWTDSRQLFSVQFLLWGKCAQ